MSSKRDGVTTDAMGRRKWDRAYFAARAGSAAAATAAAQQPARKVARRDEEAAAAADATVAARSHVAGLDDAVGKSVVVSAAAPQWAQGGFHCDACNVTLRDSASFLDHLNTQRHQRAKGAGGVPARATLADVRARLALKAGKPLPKEEKKTVETTTTTTKKKEEDEKEEDEEGQREATPETEAEELGLPISFGSSKKG